MTKYHHVKAALFSASIPNKMTGYTGKRHYSFSILNDIVILFTIKALITNHAPSSRSFSTPMFIRDKLSSGRLDHFLPSLH
jgi:hypothetical protein